MTGEQNKGSGFYVLGLRTQNLASCLAELARLALLLLPVAVWEGECLKMPVAKMHLMGAQRSRMQTPWCQPDPPPSQRSRLTPLHFATLLQAFLRRNLIAS